MNIDYRGEREERDSKIRQEAVSLLSFNLSQLAIFYKLGNQKAPKL